MSTRTRSIALALACAAGLVLALALGGCGSTRYAGRASGPSTKGYEPAPSAPVSDDRSSSGATAGRAAPAPAQSQGEALEAERKERPGLGTVFGETRSSPVQHQRFERDSETPSSTIVLYYNDESGVRSQLAYRGGAELAAVYAHAAQGGLTVALLDEAGRPLQGKTAGDRGYVVGRAGDRYAIQVRNSTGRRVEVVASVDGLDVVDGKSAATAKRGYLLEAGAVLAIDGFRLRDDAVAAFRFGRVRESYAARTGSDRNVGVIGLAFFDEKGAVWTREEVERRESASPFPTDPRYSAPPPPLAD
jgi:hypothetical protein